MRVKIYNGDTEHGGVYLKDATVLEVERFDCSSIAEAMMKRPWRLTSEDRRSFVAVLEDEPDDDVAIRPAALVFKIDKTPGYRVTT